MFSNFSMDMIFQVWMCNKICLIFCVSRNHEAALSRRYSVYLKKSLSSFSCSLFKVERQHFALFFHFCWYSKIPITTLPFWTDPSVLIEIFPSKCRKILVQVLWILYSPDSVINLFYKISKIICVHSYVCSEARVTKKTCVGYFSQKVLIRNSSFHNYLKVHVLE